MREKRQRRNNVFYGILFHSKTRAYLHLKFCGVCLPFFWVSLRSLLRSICAWSFHAFQTNQLLSCVIFCNIFSLFFSFHKKKIFALNFTLRILCFLLPQPLSIIWVKKNTVIAYILNAHIWNKLQNVARAPFFEHFQTTLIERYSRGVSLCVCTTLHMCSMSLYVKVCMHDCTTIISHCVYYINVQVYVEIYAYKFGLFLFI